MLITAWLSLLTICILGAMTPGPSLAMVLKHTINGGRNNGITVGISHGLGVAVYAVLTVLGMALIIEQTPWLFTLIKFTGAAFLLYLAYGAFMSDASFSFEASKGSSLSLYKSARDGFLLAFLNPKLAIFFIALFSQFVSADASFTEQTIMVVTVGGIDALWYCLVAFLFSRTKLLNLLHANLRKINILTAIILGGVGLSVLFT